MSSLYYIQRQTQILPQVEDFKEEDDDSEEENAGDDENEEGTSGSVDDGSE